MVQLPGEKAAERDLSESLAKHFNYAKRLLQFWLCIEFDTGLNNSKISDAVKTVVHPMYIKSCRQFRSAIQLCERGEVVDASIITRSMFETSLAIGFVLKPRFTPRKFNSDGTIQKDKRIPETALSREFRAHLFLAHHALETERFEKRHANRPGMKRFAKRIGAIASEAEEMAPFTQEIGPDWTSILLKSPGTYSGLSISNLARSLGSPFPKWYDHVYGFQSSHVHAADMEYFMQLNEFGMMTPIWQSAAEDVHWTLLKGIAVFFTIASLMNQHIEFGISTELESFDREFDELLHAE